MDRLSDIVSNPEFSQEGLKCCKLKYGMMYHSQMTTVEYRITDVLNYMRWGVIYHGSSLFGKKDLFFWLQQYFDCYYRPSNMVIYTMADLPTESMRKCAQLYFGQLANESAPRTSLSTSPRIDNSFHKTLRVDGYALLAKTYIKSEEKELSLAFPLPPQMQMSSPLYVCYFFSTSQQGSVQHKLKSEGLINYIIAEHKTISKDLQHILIEVSLTEKGSDSIQVILGYILGYLEILKKVRPSWEHFQQAKSYFQCLRRLDSSLMVLDRYSCELLLDSNISDLRDAEIPRVFNPGDIQKVFECLTLQNCFIVLASDQYTDAPLIEDSEFFLQLFIENIKVSPRFDDLAEPQIDPLIGSSRLPLVTNNDMQMICEWPIVYRKSTADEIYSMLNIGLLSSRFVEMPSTVQRLYAAMLNHKLWLETTKDICEVNVSIADNGLSIDVKSVPFSLAPLTRLLVKYLSSPIGSEHNKYLMTRKTAETNEIRLRLSENQRADPDDKDTSSRCIDLKTQLQLLESVQSIYDLPGNVKGDLVLVFSGNAIKSQSLKITSILSALQEQ